MERTSRIKMIKKLNVTEISGEKVMVDFETGKYFMIKGVGNEIWDMISSGEPTVSEIMDRIQDEYEITPEVCEEEVLSFLQHLMKLGIIEASQG